MTLLASVDRFGLNICISEEMFVISCHIVIFWNDSTFITNFISKKKKLSIFVRTNHVLFQDDK